MDRTLPICLKTESTMPALTYKYETRKLILLENKSNSDSHKDQNKNVINNAERQKEVNMNQRINQNKIYRYRND